MSIRIMAKVWKSSQARGGELLVLLAITDFANDDGMAYPSVSTLGKKARLSERQVQRAIRRLTALGELAVETEKGPHGCHLYRVTDCQGDKLSEVTSMAQGGDISGRRGVTPMSPNPKKRTIIEPSIPPTPQIVRPVKTVEPAIKLLLTTEADQPATAEWVLGRWNEIVGVKPVKIDGLERGRGVHRRVTTRLREYPAKSWWLDLFATVAGSEFLTGASTNFQASLDWVLGPENLSKIRQGNYENHGRSPSKPTTAFGRQLAELAQLEQCLHRQEVE